MCGDNIATETANVVCRTICGNQDGVFYGSILRSSMHFPSSGMDSARATNLQCKGTENFIQDCPQYQLQPGSICMVNETVGISCFQYGKSSGSDISMLLCMICRCIIQIFVEMLENTRSAV